MRQVLKDIEAGQVPDALRRLGITAKQRLLVIIETQDQDDLPLAAINASGGGFDWLADEPDIYDDGDLTERYRP